MINSILPSLVLFISAFGCQDVPNYRGDLSVKDSGRPNVGPNEDHPPSKDEVLVSNESFDNDLTQEDASSNLGQQQANLALKDILQLDVVTITGNGGLVQGSANFDDRYLNPNGLPLNKPENELTLQVGQTLSVCNAESAERGLVIHTNGAPFRHGSTIRPGACKDYRVGRTFQGNGNNMYDHNLGGAFGNRAYPIYLKVIGNEEAQKIISQ